jgi:cytochrome b6-f complex subunit 4
MAPENEEHIEDNEHEDGHPFYPHHVIDQVVMLYVLIGVVITLAVLVPFGLHEKADALHTPIGIKPEWYFMSSYQLLKYAPKSIAFVIMGIAGMALVFWPFIDAAVNQAAAYRRLHISIGAGVLILVLAVALVWCASGLNMFAFSAGVLLRWIALMAGGLVLWWGLCARLVQRAPRLLPHKIIGGVALGMILTLGLVGYVSERNVTVFGQKYHIDLMGWPQKGHASEDVGH